MPVGPPAGFVVRAAGSRPGARRGDGAGLTSRGGERRRNGRGDLRVAGRAVAEERTPADRAADGQADDETKVANSDALLELDAIRGGSGSRGSAGRPWRAAAGTSGTRRRSARSRRSRSDSDAPIGGEGGPWPSRRLPRPSARDLDCHGSSPTRRRHDARCSAHPQPESRHSRSRLPPSEGPAPAVRSPRPWQRV